MTLPLNSRLSALYDTNGTQKDFGFGFRVFFDPDNGGYGLEVRRQTADGYEVIPKSDYLVLPVEDNSAGVVRFSVAPSAGQQIYIAGKTPTIQQLVLTNFGRYSAESIETQFDFITAIIQEWLSALGEETRQRIAADDILTQYVVQRIDAFVQQVNQNWDDKSQEIEDYIATIMPSFTQTLREEIEAYAVAGMQDAIDQTLAESKAEIDDAVARANAAALAAAITGKVYDTPEAGVNPVTGVQNGAYYNVRSLDDDSYLVEYQNIGGVPTPSGKSYPSSEYVQSVSERLDDVSLYTAQPLKPGKTYILNERVVLANGDVVRSLIPNNTNDPNSNMDGWVRVNSTTQIYDDILGQLQSVINKRSADVLRWITPQEFGAVGDGVADDSDAFKDCITYAVTRAFIPMSGGNARIGVGIRVPATEGGYRIAKPQYFIPNLGTTRYAGLVFEGEGKPLIYFDYDGNDYMCYNNNQFLLLQFSNINFYCNSDSSKFLFSTANGGTQGYTFFDCEWNGKWNKIYVLRGVNNNSEWKWIASNITCAVRDVMLDIAESDQFLNYWFYGCKIWLYDGQCVRASAGGHITFVSCDWSGLQGTREMCTSTKGKYLFELTGISHARGVCSFRIIDGRFECKVNSAGSGINARLLYCEWGQGNVELNIDASSTILSEFDNEYSVHMNRGNAGGAMLSIRSSFLIGKLKFESSTAAFEKNKHTISDTTFGSLNLKKPSDFIEITSPNPNPAGASAVKLDNCRPSIGNGVFNSSTLTFTPWDLTLGSRNSLSAGTSVNIAEFKGSSYGGNPTGNNACYLQLPPNSTVLSVRALCDGTGTTQQDSTWEVADDSTGTILLTCSAHKISQRWFEESKIPYRSTTGLLKLIDKTAGGQTQSTSGFKCIVEYMC